MEFLSLTEITLEISILILFISVVGKLFQKRLDPNIRYLMWLMVAVRLLVPIRLEVPLEIPGLANVNAAVAEFIGSDGEAADGLLQARAEALAETRPEPQTVDLSDESDTLKGVIQAEDVSAEDGHPNDGLSSLPAVGQQDANRQVSALQKAVENGFRAISAQGAQVLFVLWLCGIVLAALFVWLNNKRLYEALKSRRKELRILENGLPLYDMPGYNCLAGTVHPAIYVDAEGIKDPLIIENVIRHELQHFRVKDHYWQLLRVICLILQWYNPFMWWAYFASKRDCELACDRRVTKDLSQDEKYGYGSSLLTVAECVIKKRNVALATSMGENKKFMAERIKMIMRRKSKYSVILATVMLCVVCLVGFLSFQVYAEMDGTVSTQKDLGKEGPEDGKGQENLTGGEEENSSEEMQTEKKQPEEVRPENGQSGEIKALDININLEDYYITNTGDTSNLYYVDEDGVLWGCGRNECGQLGQGTKDFDFHEDMVKMAENVIHVDYSQNGFVIYLTEDHKLYGVGMAAALGALSKEDEADWRTVYYNLSHYVETTPLLLMENVAYARCGRTDVVCLTLDGGVFSLGLNAARSIGWNHSIEADYYSEPVKLLENAAFVTGGFFSHAALLKDGTVWTWGYNYAGNCGVTDAIVTTPTKVAEDVIMVWTGSTQYNIDCQDISEIDSFYKRSLDNTIIQKSDGSYFICGANVGTEEKILPVYYEAVDYPLVCTHKFHPIKVEEDIEDWDYTLIYNYDFSSAE